MSTKKTKRNKPAIRLCISCNAEKPKGDMLRIVVAADDSGQAGKLDETGRAKGRGAYICRNRDCIKHAAEKKLISEEDMNLLLESMEKYGRSMLSLAAKAGKVCSGEFQCETAIADGKACFVIIAEDASENTKKKFLNKCSFHKLPHTIYGGKDELGRLIGRDPRSCVVITDQGIGSQLESVLVSE